MTAFPAWWPGSATSTGEQPSAGLWAQLKAALDVSQSRPAQAEGVVAKEMRDGTGHHFILKNPRTRTYARLSPPEFWVWQKIDGRQTVQQLVMAYFIEYKAFAFGAIVGMLEQLRAQNMLTEPPRRLYGNISQALEERTLLHKLTWPARAAFTKEWVIKGLDDHLTRLYRAGAWTLFALPTQIIFLLISVVGTILFTLLLNDPRYKLFESDLAAGAIWLVVLSYVPLIIHEFGHAITAKHFGCEVHRGGVLLYYGTPAAFVDTTDVWMHGKRARLGITWAGPYTGFILGGLCAVVVYFWPDIQGARILFQLAFVFILTSAVNLIPMLKLDGYYLLADGLEIPRLRERSLDFLKSQFIRKLLRREAWTREEKIFVVFGLVSALSSAYFAYFGVAFWNKQASHSWAQLVSRQGNLISLITDVTIILLAASSVIFGAYEAYRHGRASVGWARRAGLLSTPARAALVLALSAVGLTFGPALILPNLSTWLMAVTGTLGFGGAAYLAASIYRDMRGSLHANLWPVMAVGLAAGGLVHPIAFAPALNDSAPILDLVGLALSVLAVVIGAQLFIGLRRSWRAVSAGMLALGVLAWGAAWIAGTSEAARPAHLFSGLIGAGALLHWRMFPRGAVHTASILTTANDTAKEHLTGAFLWLATTTLRDLQVEYSHAAAHRAAAMFNRLSRERGWNVAHSPPPKPEWHIGLEEADLSVSDYGGVLAQALDALLDSAARIAGTAFARRALTRGYDGLNWEQQELAEEYLLRYTRWATGLTAEFAGRRDEAAALLHAAPIFATLSDEEVRAVGRVLRPRYFVQGKPIIRQGEAGEEFFILRQGRVEVLQRDASGVNRKVNALTRGDYFGETSLLTGERRNATIRALTPVEALTMTRRDFNRLLRDDFAAHDKIETAVRRVGLLRQTPIFAEFEGFELRLVAAQLDSLEAPAGQTIFRHGDPGDRFYVIESGEVSVRLAASDGAPQENEVERARLGPGEYFGEIALLMDLPRTATVVTTRPTTLLTLDAERFNKMVRESRGFKQALERAGSRRVLSNAQWLRQEAERSGSGRVAA